MDKIPVSAIVLTQNEEKNIERCLKALAFAGEIIIIDDNSQDNTAQIAKKYHAYVVNRLLNGDFARQRNTALEQTRFPWVLFIDADEVVSPELRTAIRTAVVSTTYDAYFVRRREYYLQTEIKFGEVSQVRKHGLIRLVHKGSGRWAGNVHEEYKPADSTKVGTLTGFLDHYPHADLRTFLEDINRYSSLRAHELYENKQAIHIWQIVAYPFGKFLYTYVWLQGYRDGANGFIYSFLMSFHSFLVRAKLYQYTYLP